MQIQEQGIAIPSSTRIGGHFAIRVANTNHRTRREDFDALVDGVLSIGATLTAQPTAISEEVLV